jgi:NAD(P)-dependent dehydrogenase (short-subunit alcohol dehydrogenase family)
MPTMLITGANRGLGLGIAKHAAANGYTVIGTARNPQTADELRAVASIVEELHTDSQDSIESFAKQFEGEPIDVLVNNAGIFPHECDDINDFDVAAYERVMRVNTLGPILTTRALISSIANSDRKLVVSITSNLGSITDASKGEMGFLGYRTSKAALNMANAAMAQQLKPKGITSVVLHPGWVQTDMGGPQAPLTPEDATGQIFKTIDGLEASQNGAFLDYRGKELPW